jgi:hypothetical protein
MTYDKTTREDGRVGFYDKAGGWHTGPPVPNWADFLRDIGLDPRAIPSALDILGVKAGWSAARRYHARRGSQGAVIPHESIVYYMECPSRLIKIGTTMQLHSRWIAYGHKPDRPTALRAVERADEQAILHHFQALRLNSRSEYLTPAPELLAWVSERSSALMAGR